MNRRLVCVALMVAIGCVFLASGALAGDQDKDTSIYGNYPPVMTKENPYAQELAAARTALDDAIKHFWEVYSNNPWNYSVIVEAYWAYVDAYRRYTWVLWKYWEWERNNRAFSGRILTKRDWPPILYATDGTQAGITEGGCVRPPTFKDVPVPGATIRLTYNPIMIMNQGTTTVDSSQNATTQIYPSPVINRVYTTTSNDKGEFQFKNLPRGNFRYVVSKEGFSSASGDIEIGVSEQKKDIYLNSHRVFNGQVLTVNRDVWVILKPLLCKTTATAATAGASASATSEAVTASAEDVEKILGSQNEASARILPVNKKLVPVEGARVTLNSLIRYAVPMASGATDASVSNQTATTAAAATDSIRCPPYYPPTPSTTTDSNGKFHFENLAQTSYQAVVEKAGYIPFRAMVTLDRTSTYKRIVIFPLLPGEPVPIPVPMPAQQSDTTGGTLNNPFGN